MRKRLTAFIMILSSIVMLCACGGKASSDAESPSERTAGRELSEVSERQSAEEIADGILQQTQFKGVAYIVKDGSVVYDRGFGRADSEGNLENTADTVFRIASNTKQFTAAAVMLLQQEGKLSVNDTLDRYFPDYPHAKEVTVHELLCMRSGIKDYMAYTDANGNHIALRESELEYSVSDNASSEQNRAAVKEWLFAQALNFTPDEKMEYSNSNYLLLAEIIEQVSGMTYEEYIKANIFEPVGMTASGFFDSYDIADSVVAQPQTSEPALAYMNYPGMSFGAGDMLSNAKDIAAWLDSLADHRLLTEESWTAMTTNHSHDDDIMPYGYGLMIDDGGLYHSGYLPSFSSAFYTVPDQRYSMILMSNAPSGNIETIMKRMNRELNLVNKES